MPSPSVTTSAGPIGVASRSTEKISGGFAGIGLLFLGCTRGARSPQMLRRIGAPRPPGFRPLEQILRRRTAGVAIRHRAQEADIGGRERVGLAQLAHGNVLRSP